MKELISSTFKAINLEFRTLNLELIYATQ